MVSRIIGKAAEPEHVPATAGVLGGIAGFLVNGASLFATVPAYVYGSTVYTLGKMTQWGWRTANGTHSPEPAHTLRAKVKRFGPAGAGFGAAAFTLATAPFNPVGAFVHGAMWFTGGKLGVKAWESRFGQGIRERARAWRTRRRRA